jgi:UDP-N-acetyl-D-mannosaminuronate dehydrogenase
MNHIVVGCGEVGQALMRVLQCEGHDPGRNIEAPPAFKCDILHVCFPFVGCESFHSAVRDYQERFVPMFTVIHSTVPIGTSDALDAHHSPIRGRHPHLVESIRTFVKYVGGPRADDVCAELRTFGIPCVPLRDARTTEAAKLIDLMQFGAAILLAKEIHEFCEREGFDFDVVYRQFNETYNAGYQALGASQFTRPILDHQPGPIGGHCVVENMKHLESPIAEKILETNAQLARVVTEVSR